MLISSILIFGRKLIWGVMLRFVYYGLNHIGPIRYYNYH
jgi:hypothetical protein